ncbi:hypothetical protein MUN88_06535 [Gracilibacillus caseinilyticus]|uniref:Uncharacterized protein n=1 Tax=Gracilibacillus caseinilyticus TaxID=2932256 RepID=A0ABY4EZA3_9BACI|nr:hypothetical protein [Gracilibacillus caseinilyticus]UOQ49731.1 hypothetical protein MUN88_06535 [Gracilibacillus caseinilyticus]
MTKEVTSKDNRIIATTLLLIFIGFLTGSMPTINMELVISNILLAIISCCLFYVIWKKTKHDSKRYFSLFSYVMFNCIAIQLSTPFLRLNFLTISFWVGIIILLLMVTLPYIFSREIVFGIKNANKSKLGKIYLIFSILMIALGTVLYSDSIYSDDINATGASIYSFLAALLFLFSAPIMLIKPKEVKQISNRDKYQN